MWTQTPLTERLGIRYPLIQAPMAGGPTTPELAAAVSAAGGLGVLGAGYQTPDQIRAAIRGVRALTDRPFGVNLLLTEAVAPSAEAIARAQALLQPFRNELGLGAPEAISRFAESFEDQVAVLLEERVPVFSWAFGIPAPEVLEAFRAQGAVLVGTATTVAEARALESAGTDLVVAQGGEAGGHRGTFLGPFEAALVGTMALVPQVVEAVRLPVVAAGGIMDGRGIVAALALGAAGVQMGTAFLNCDEAGTNAHHRGAIAQSTEESTCITRAFSGKPVRAIENRFIRELRPHEPELPGYPVQNALTRELRSRATALGRTDLMGMWAGQASRMCRTGPAASLIAAWIEEAERVLGRLGVAGASRDGGSSG